MAHDIEIMELKNVRSLQRVVRDCCFGHRNSRLKTGKANVDIVVVIIERRLLESSGGSMWQD